MLLELRAELRGQGPGREERGREKAKERQSALPGLGKMGKGLDDLCVALSRVHL